MSSVSVRVSAPEVSLITSWHIPPPRQPRLQRFPSLRLGLRQRIRLHDLYFLDPGDVADFASAADPNERSFSTDPLEFAASLIPEHLARIGDQLTEILADEYRGERVGLRPRFAALATYWPMLGLPDSEAVAGPESTGSNRRVLSVRAVRNSLRLAAYLGCRHVEIVGGSAIPESAEAQRREQDPAEYRAERLRWLARSLIEVFEGPGGSDFVLEFAGRVPFVTMELEPGEAFLIKDLGSFVKLRELLEGHLAHRYTLLNIDLAHLFLCQDAARCGALPNVPGGETGTAGPSPVEDTPDPATELRRHGLLEWVGHFHISDHARTHAADLTPGTYHFIKDYLPWLKLAVKLASNPFLTRYSRVIAVEMEACNDILEVTRAIGRVERWLDQARLAVKASESTDTLTLRGSDGGVASPGSGLGESEATEKSMSRGFLLVADIGRSTESIFRTEASPTVAVLRLERLVASICRAIQVQRGSVLSFTGDGIVAFFDEDHFLSAKDGAKSALAAAERVRRDLEPEVKGSNLTVRVALHRGQVFIPLGGQLRHQALGPDVILACRLCDWLGKVQEPALSPVRRDFLFGCTRAFLEKADGVDGIRAFHEWGSCELKGLPGSVEIHLRHS